MKGVRDEEKGQHGHEDGRHQLLLVAQTRVLGHVLRLTPTSRLLTPVVVIHRVGVVAASVGTRGWPLQVLHVS